MTIPAVFSFALMACSGCIEYGPPGQPKTIPRAITFMVSSSTTSNFTPCGCHSGKWGGMPRRGTIFLQVEDEVDWDVIYVDTGDVVQGAVTETLELKNKYIFQAYDVMDYDFVNVGDNDLKLGYEELARVELENNIPWTSANIYAPGVFPDLPPGPLGGTVSTPTSTTNNPGNPGATQPANAPINPIPEGYGPSIPDAEPLFAPYRIIEPENAPGYKIGMIGMVIEDAGRLNPMRDQFSFERYDVALEQVVSKLRNEERVDLVVLVTDTDNFQNINTDELFRDIDIVIGGNLRVEQSPNATHNPLNPRYMPQGAPNPSRPDNVQAGDGADAEEEIQLEPIETPLIFPKGYGRGRIVRRFDITLDAGGRIVDYYTQDYQVSDQYEDDPRMAEIARGYDTDVHSIEMMARVGRNYSGSQACEDCHPGFLAAWSSHPHFHAYDTIVQQNALDDRECTRCHAIGFVEEPRLLTYDLIPESHRNVGCEGCHPNGYRHKSLQEQLARQSPEIRAQSTITDAMTQPIMQSTCTQCHTGEWGQGFDFNAAMAAARAVCQAAASGR